MTALETAQAMTEAVPDQQRTRAGPHRPSGSAPEQLQQKSSAVDAVQAYKECGHHAKDAKPGMKEQDIEVGQKKKDIEAGPNEHDKVSLKELGIEVSPTYDIEVGPKDQDTEVDQKELDIEVRLDAEAGPKEQDDEYHHKGQDRQSISQDTEIGWEEKKKKQKVRNSTAIRRMPMKILLCGIILVCCLHMAEATNFHLVKTKQLFPQNCSSLLKGGCHNRLHFPSWTEMNQNCCRFYPGDFHCQLKENQIDIIIGCLPQQVIPAGKTGELIVNESGDPELDNATNCSTGTYRPKSINSSDNVYGYCLELKGKVNPKTEIRMCDGGPVDDDRFFCKKGYKSKCPHGRYRDNDCTCQPYQCDNGSQPFQEFTGSCSDKNLTVFNGCRKEHAMSSPTPPRSQGNSSVTPPGLTTSTPHSTTNTSQSGMSTEDVIGIVFGVIFLITVVIGFWWW